MRPEQEDTNQNIRSSLQLVIKIAATEFSCLRNDRKIQLMYQSKSQASKSQPENQKRSREKFVQRHASAKISQNL